MTSPSYNLLDEPWIPALSLTGVQRDYSLLDLFRSSQEVQRIVGDVPTQAFAIFRICLAILHRATSGPESTDDWHGLWETRNVPIDDIERYLNLHRERFYLFHPKAPFFQVADLHTTKNEVSPLSKIVVDVPAGHQYFSMRSGEGVERLAASEAARWLVHVHAFDISGIKTGVVGDPRVKGGRGYPIGTGWAGAIGGVMVERDNLWRTLLLNLVPDDHPEILQHSDRDRPAWEAPPSLPSEAKDVGARPYGPMDLFTWQARRVRLFGDESGVTGVLVANGDKITPHNRFRNEPMSTWRFSAAQQKKLKESGAVYMPRQHDPSRALWRGMSQLLPFAARRGKADDSSDDMTAGVINWAGEALDPNQRVTVRAIGMDYGTQNSVVNDIFHDELTLSVGLLSETSAILPGLVIDAVRRAEEGVRALRNLAANLVLAAGGDPILADGARDDAGARAYADIDPVVRDWIASLDATADVEQTPLEWNRSVAPILRDLGRDLVENSSTGAWVGREVRGRRITTPEAAAWFYRALNKALPTEITAQEEESV